jgi:hypothetical protein
LDEGKPVDVIYLDFSKAFDIIGIWNWCLELLLESLRFILYCVSLNSSPTKSTTRKKRAGASHCL